MDSETKSSLLKQMVWLAALALLVLVGYPITMALRADGRIDYCYVEAWAYQAPLMPDQVVYTLHGHRPWRVDRAVSLKVPTLDEVRRRAELMGCELR